MLSTGASFCSGLATFVSQAYGQGDARLCRVYLNRQVMLNFVAFAILWIPMIFIKQIYRAIG
jgi:Na+-driven multidrug efflux pump